MQKLHPVGFTDELDGLILSARKGSKTGRFVVPLDGRLLKMLAEADRGRGRAVKDAAQSASPRLVLPDSSLTPREMQDRIRTGWTVQEVADEAGVDHDWVRRFASPVLAEVGRVIDRAREVTFDKPRVGMSTLPLGAAVRRNVLERGVRIPDEELDECWSAHQLADDEWIVRFVYTSRGRAQEAEWVFDIGTEALTSNNRLASQLGHVARRRRSTASAAAAPKKKAPAKKAAARKKPAARRTSAGKKKAASKKAPARKKPAAKRTR